MRPICPRRKTPCANWPMRPEAAPASRAAQSHRLRGPSGGSALRAVAPTPRRRQSRRRRRSPRRPASGSRASRTSSRSRGPSATFNCRRRWRTTCVSSRFEAGRIAFSLIEGASPQIAQTLSRRLQEWTGERWMVALVAGSTAPTLRESASAERSRAPQRRRRQSAGAQDHGALPRRADRRSAQRPMRAPAPRGDRGGR